LFYYSEIDVFQGSGPSGIDKKQTQQKDASKNQISTNFGLHVPPRAIPRASFGDPKSTKSAPKINKK